MSRIGKRPIPLPAKVSVTIAGREVTVKGPKGELTRTLPPLAAVVQEGNELVVTRKDESRFARQQHGLTRTLVANMVEGVTNGFSRRLEIQGVGYRAAVKGKTLFLSVGYSIKELPFEPPDGIQVAVENNTNILVSGIDKELVGNTAARIRAVRPPEVYKGKGIRYAGEVVRRKAGKSGKKK
ncbi:MAG: 50S ribosomal protein L6 [Pseudanabaenaceae cyanobacterium]